MSWPSGTKPAAACEGFQGDWENGLDCAISPPWHLPLYPLFLFSGSCLKDDGVLMKVIFPPSLFDITRTIISPERLLVTDKPVSKVLCSPIRSGNIFHGVNFID